MQSREIKAVVFDLDGLMFNTEELYRDVGTIQLQRRGKIMTEELLTDMMGHPPQVAIQTMIDRHQLDDTVAQLRAESDEIFSEILDDRLAPMPGLLELLDVLEHAAFDKAIATSSHRGHVTRVLAQFDLEPRFRFLLTSDDVTYGKPHPEIYCKASARLGFHPSNIMVLEDSEVGCRAAVAAGCFAIAVPGVFGAKSCYDGVQLIADSLADKLIFSALGLAGK